MSSNNRLTWINMRDKLAAMGGVASAVLGEPKSKMQNGTVSIIPEAGSVDETVLNAPREIHTVTLRRYENALQFPEDVIEFTLDAWRADICEDIFGDFDLGGTIAYVLPASTSWQYGYVTVENILYRFLDISISYRVDPTATFAA